MLEITDQGGFTLAELRTGQELGSVQDAKEAIANASYLHADYLLLEATQLPEGFFDLSSGVAGEVMQTAATFHVQLKVTGDFSHVTSQAFQALMLESNRHGGMFLPDRETALNSIRK